ncbi:beta family protein [Microbulbifer sp. SSSA002]|uniref:beta family protein n=1 Tax=Microbulbifer sp. SSSA002 TaxID=3243376 RepID=UPI00403A34C8
MSKIKYFPLIKTRDSEIRCFLNLPTDLKQEILPIYELTKSRKTKKVPDGDIYRRMKSISEIQGDSPFILDLTMDDRYINTQIRQLLSPQHGFSEWKYFIFDIFSNLNIIPMIHIVEDEDSGFPELRKFVENASKKKPNLAVRIPHDLSPEEFDTYLSPIKDTLHKDCKVYVFLDGEYVRREAENDITGLAGSFTESCAELQRVFNDGQIEKISMLGSSFPTNPAQAGGDDAEGEFPVYEEEIYKLIQENYPDIGYGDYVSINTEQVEIRGARFVPRIDVFQDDGRSFVYKRYRQKDGGYPKCARRVKEDGYHYKEIPSCWASKEIALASANNASGLSPSFWISVRMNYYIHKILDLRSTT